MIGGEDYTDFLTEVHKIDNDTYKKTADIERTAKNQKAALAKKIFHKEDK